MEFIEAPPFARHRESYLADDEFRAFQEFLAENPEAGDVMPGTGGARKLRWQDQKRGKGKRGGLRIIYYLFFSEHQIYLITLYDKDEMKDFIYTQEAPARIRTVLGELDTLVVASQRNGSNRLLRMWFAPSLGYVPVQAERTRDGKLEFAMRIETLQP